jgi:hypothetical protein
LALLAYISRAEDNFTQPTLPSQSFAANISNAVL